MKRLQDSRNSWNEQASSPSENLNSLEFGIHFKFPIRFTHNLFSSQNPVFRSETIRLEPGKLHRVFFVIDKNVAAAHPGLIAAIEAYFAAYSDSLELFGEPLLITGGEHAKNDMSHVISLLRRINSLGIDRQSFIAAIGGGAVLDMAGFSAAIAHRGIRLIRIPTTVLSQCDSGVGVKNGVNLFGKKNFVGVFAPPFAVLNDSLFIESLEHRDKIGGIAEGIKVALIRDRSFYEYLECNAPSLAAGDLQSINFQIRRSAQLHVEHIQSSGDPYEMGSARPLDFGHWSAHKLESLTSNRLRHGQAVAIGMALDLVYSVKKGFLREECGERILSLLERIGFDLWVEALQTKDNRGGYAVLQGLQDFREHLGGNLHVTLIRDIGSSFEVQHMDEEIIIYSIQWLKRRHDLRVDSQPFFASESAGTV